jgi:ABC-2 type transport system permease protein
VNGLIAVYRRELAAYFETPLAYVFLAVFAGAAPALTWHAGGLFETGRADLATFFDMAPWLLVVLMPALAMRAWSEELSQGTLEGLLAAPIGVWEMATAKFLAAWTVAGLALALTVPLWIAVNYLGAPDNAAIMTAYLGSLLLAGAYLALGQALSAATGNQVIAFVLGAGACLLVTAAGAPMVADALSARLPSPLAEGLAELSALARFDSLRRGVASARDLIYFLSLSGVGLIVATALVDARRGGAA